MFGPFERAVAGRYLRARRGERFVSIIAGFSLLGTALGVGTLIVVMSVMGGVQTDLLSRILGFDGHVNIYPGGSAMTQPGVTAAQVRTLPGVTFAAAVIDGQVLFQGSRGELAPGLVLGIGQEDIRNLHAVSDHIIAGSLDDFKGEDVVAIGLGLANKFRLQLGGELTMVSPEGAATAFGTIPRVRAYRVAAIFQVGAFQYDSGYAFLPLPAAQIYFQKPDQASRIEVMVADPERATDTGRTIASALANTPLRVQSWQQRDNSYFAAVKIQRNVLFLILLLIILVAAFNVISTMIMLVKDKTRDIAVLRTIGAGRGAVMRVFVMVGAAIGVLGTLLGTVLGVLFCWNIEKIQGWVEFVTGSQVFSPEVYFLSHLPARLDPNEVIQIVLIALALTLLATLYPSWRAARTDPVEALRHE